MNLKWNNPADENAATRYLLDAILMYRNAGMQQWQLLKLAAKMWEDPNIYLAQTMGVKNEDKGSDEIAADRT